MKRRGLGKGLGKGYKNLVPRDPLIHGLSAKGVKTYQVVDNYGVTWKKGLKKKEAEKLAKRLNKKTKFELKPMAKLNAKYKKVTEKNLVDYIIEYESGNPTVAETLELFSYLIKSGKAWSLQHMYGRQAERLIDAGLIDKNGKINWKEIPNPDEKIFPEDDVELDAKGRKYQRPRLQKALEKLDLNPSLAGKVKITKKEQKSLEKEYKNRIKELKRSDDWGSNTRARILENDLKTIKRGYLP